MEKRFFLLVILFTAITFSMAAYSAQVCGNSVCEEGEDSCACPSDCGKCSGEVKGKYCSEYYCSTEMICSIKKILNCCRNEICEDGESYGNCPADCEPRSVNVEVLAPQGIYKARYGEQVLYKISVDADGANVAGAGISVSGPFERNIEFFNDGLHEDEKFSDRIYAARISLQSDTTPGIKDVNFSAKFRGLEGKKTLKIEAYPFIDLEVDSDGEVELGNTINMKAKASINGKPAPAVLKIELINQDGDLIERKELAGDENIDFKYRTTFADKPGKWNLHIFGSDQFGNRADWNRALEVYEPGKTPQREMTLIKSLKESYSAGEEMEVAIKVLENSAPVSTGYAFANFGEVKQSLLKIGEGEYAFTLRIPTDIRAGKHALEITFFNAENVLLATEEFDLNITAASITMQIISPDKKIFEAGEEIEFVVLLFYADNSPVQDAEVSALFNGKKLPLKIRQPGVFSAKYTAEQSDYGYLEVSIIAATPQGAVAEMKNNVFISGKSIFYDMQKYSYLLLIGAAIIIGISALIFRKIKNRSVKIGRHEELKRIDMLEKEAQTRYFREKTINKEEYNRLMDNYGKARRKLG